VALAKRKHAHVNDKTPSYFDAPHGPRLAYFMVEGSAPTVLFLGGMMSDMRGAKAVFLEGVCGRKGRAFIRFDYSGHGASGGSFKEGTISSWLKDVLAVIDNLITGPIVLVGSSLGGWLALLAALKRPEHVKGLVCLAPAADFTEQLLRPYLTPAQLADMEQTGEVHIPSEYGDDPYIFTKALFDDGKNHLILDGPIKLDIPVRLLHGGKDNDVPSWISDKIIERLVCPDARLVFMEDADHRLSAPAELSQIEALVEDVIDNLTE